jgi:hypothetical protein
VSGDNASARAAHEARKVEKHPDSIVTIGLWLGQKCRDNIVAKFTSLPWHLQKRNGTSVCTVSVPAETATGAEALPSRYDYFSTACLLAFYMTHPFQDSTALISAYKQLKPVCFNACWLMLKENADFEKI